MQNCAQNIHYNAKCASFYMAALISLLSLIFSFVKLFNLSPNEDRSVYIGLIATIISLWIPSPSLPKNEPRRLDTDNAI